MKKRSSSFGGRVDPVSQQVDNTLAERAGRTSFTVIDDTGRSWVSDNPNGESESADTLKRIDDVLNLLRRGRLT